MILLVLKIICLPFIVLYQLARQRRKAKAPRVGYYTYLASHEWATKRRQVLVRDHYKCTQCSSRSRLEVHHKTYRNLGHEPLEDLTTLCFYHHRQADAARRRN